MKAEMSQDTFHCAILAYLDNASDEDYLAFATWLNESKTEH